MSQSVNTYAIVIKQQDFKDYDRIVTLFTYDLGKLSALAKGVRRSKSGRLGVLQSGNVVRVQLTPHHDWNILRETLLVSSCQDFLGSTILTGYLYHTLELLDVLLAQEPLRDVFKLSVEFMAAMKTSPRHVLMRAFELKLLSTLGFLPARGSSAYCAPITPIFVDEMFELVSSDWENLANARFDEKHNSIFKTWIIGYIENMIEKRLKSLSFFA